LIIREEEAIAARSCLVLEVLTYLMCAFFKSPLLVASKNRNDDKK